MGGKRRGKAKKQKPTAVLTADEDLFDERDGDGDEGESPADDPKSPPDVTAKSLREMARLLGVHYNTLDNWKRKGLEPPGAVPWSLKAYCLLLRPSGKLTECRPTTEKVRAIHEWAFGATKGGSANPDDPAHGRTVGWVEEDKRQSALSKLEIRKQERMKTEQMAGRLKDDDEVRAMLRDLHNLVVGELSSVQNVANQVRGLTPAQRADIGDALTEWQTEAKQRIAQAAAQHAKTLEAARVDAG